MDSPLRHFHPTWPRSAGEADFRAGVESAAAGHYELAIGYFIRAAEAGYHLLVAQLNKSTCYARLGNHKAALLIINGCIHDKPNEPDLYFFRGIALVRLGMHRKAVASLDAFIANAPDHADGYYARACAKALMGQTDEALADVDTAARLRPSSREEMRADPDLASLLGHPAFEASTGSTRRAIT